MRAHTLANTGNKLSLVTKKDVKGAVYSMCVCNGKLVAGIGKKVSVFKWTAETDESRCVCVSVYVCVLVCVRVWVCVGVWVYMCIYKSGWTGATGATNIYIIHIIYIYIYIYIRI